jgi:hypothetical protein
MLTFPGHILGADRPRRDRDGEAAPDPNLTLPAINYRVAIGLSALEVRCLEPRAAREAGFHCCRRPDGLNVRSLWKQTWRLS